MLQLPLRQRRRTQTLAREKLQQLLRAVARVESTGNTWDPEPTELQFEPLHAKPLDEMPTRTVYAAHWFIARNRDAEWNLTWDRVLARRAELLEHYRTRSLSGNMKQRRQRLVSLTAVTAGLMIPLLCRRSENPQAAIELADAHLALMLSRHYRKVVGAGSDRDKFGQPSPYSRMILLSPVLWSTAGYVPLTPTMER